MRVQVVGLLASVGALTGALVGLLGGAVWQATSLPAATPALAAGAALTAAALDVVRRPAPPSVRRQVPQLWGRLFGPRLVAVLYGARLGVGPATILSSWLWWASLVVGAACGPWIGALTGAAFAVVRTATTELAVAAVDGGEAMSRRIARINSRDGAARLGVAVAVAALVAVGLLAAAVRDGGDPTPAGKQASPLVEKPSSTTVTSTLETKALDDVLLDDTLDGFRRDDRALGTGPLDLEAAAGAEPDVDAERALLETRGFVRGMSRGWVGPGDDTVYVAAYEFARQADAAAYLADGREHLAARAAAPLDVTRIPGAVGFTTLEHADDKTFTTHVVAFTKATRWFLVLVSTAGQARPVQEAVDLAARQAEAAPAT